ncbi:hypothetical protein EJB05_05687, partial [Eragrostis curvula]
MREQLASRHRTINDARRHCTVDDVVEAHRRGSGRRRSGEEPCGLEWMYGILRLCGCAAVARRRPSALSGRTASSGEQQHHHPSPLPLAHGTQEKNHEVIKMLGNQLQAFRQELDVLQLLWHPNVVQFICAVTQSSTIMIVMKFTRKESGFGIVSNNLDMDVDQSVHWDAILLVVIPAMQAADVISSRALRLAKNVNSDCLYFNLKNKLSASITINCSK